MSTAVVVVAYLCSFYCLSPTLQRVGEAYLPLCVRVARVSETIRVSDGYYEWLQTHNRDGETMEETLRRVTGGPRPEAIAGLLTDEEATTAKAAVADLRERGERLDTAREAFDDDA